MSLFAFHTARAHRIHSTKAASYNQGLQNKHIRQLTSTSDVPVNNFVPTDDVTFNVPGTGQQVTLPVPFGSQLSLPFVSPTPSLTPSSSPTPSPTPSTSPSLSSSPSPSASAASSPSLLPSPSASPSGSPSSSFAPSALPAPPPSPSCTTGCRCADPGPLPGDPTFDESQLDAFGLGETTVWVASDFANGGVFRTPWKRELVSYDGSVLTLSIQETSAGVYEGAEIRTNANWYGYGCMSSCMKPSGVSGVISSLFSFTGPSDGINGAVPQNEIDIEFQGKDVTEVQFNFCM